MANLLSLPTSSKNSVLTLIVFVLAFDLAFVGQKLGGAYQNEFGGHPQEASHYMSGLFWRDFAVAAWRARAEGKTETLSEEKKNFAQNYLAHYPHPDTRSERYLFHSMEAVWMLAFPATRGSLLVLMAALLGIAATQLFGALRQEYGWVWAGLATAALIALPWMRKFTGLVMPDALSVVLVFGAAMAVGDFVDRERKKDASLAGILGGLAILNDASGFTLWMVILLTMVGARKSRLLRSPAFWGMNLLLMAASIIRGGWSDPAESTRSYLMQFGSAVGLLLGAFMIIGMMVKLRPAGDYRGRWVAAGALVIFSTHPLPALPAALMFAVAGGSWLAQWIASRSVWSRKGAGFRASVLALLGALALASVAGPWTKEPCTGFAPLAEMLIDDSAPEDVTLVSSDASGEERFIAELAMREQRPGHTVLSGTLLLAKPGKKLMNDEPALPDDKAMFDFLTSGKIKYVVLDDAIPDEERREHHYQIRRAIEEHLNRFWVIANCPVTRDGVPQTTPAKLYKIR